MADPTSDTPWLVQAGLAVLALASSGIGYGLKLAFGRINAVEETQRAVNKDTREEAVKGDDKIWRELRALRESLEAHQRRSEERQIETIREIHSAFSAQGGHS